MDRQDGSPNSARPAMPAGGAAGASGGQAGAAPADTERPNTEQPDTGRESVAGNELHVGAGVFSAFEWMLALRYLRARRRETFISVIAAISFTGIALGVATLIVVMAVMNGFRSQLLTKILGFSGHIVVQSVDNEIAEFDTLAGRMEMLAPVTAAMPFVEGQALMSGPNGAFGVLVRGVGGRDLRRMPLLPGAVTQGDLSTFDEAGEIVIGERLAARLGVQLGDSISLIIPRGTVSPLGVLPRVKAYPIAALFNVGMSQFDSSVVFMPFSESQLFFNKENVASGIDLFTEDPDSVSETRQFIEPLTAADFRLTDWRQRNLVFFSALQVERNVMFIVLTMIILVAALNIVSGLTMLVKEKGHDIAVLRTMGATRGAVMRIFLVTGASIGIAGTLAGLLLGIAICLHVEEIRQILSYFSQTELFSPELYFLSQLPADLDSFDTFLVVIMGIALSFLATLYPSWRAARLDPVEALRYE